MLAAAALIPLAWLIGEATEHAAEHTGPGIGGFLNATFGNAPELIIAPIAVNTMGLTEVVRGSLTGSVIGNLLLVLGFSLLFGGREDARSRLELPLARADRPRDALFLIVAIPGWDGDPDRSIRSPDLRFRRRSCCCVVYVGVTWYSLRRHRDSTSRATRRWKAGRFGFRLLVLGVATV